MRKKVFILCFLLSLIAPTLIYPLLKNKIDTTNHENRILAEFPEISIQNFANIPSEFEKYYNDHIPFKNYFIRIKSKIDIHIFQETSVMDVTTGKDRWLFYMCREEGVDALADYQHSNLYTVEQEKEIAVRIKSIEKELQERNIRFYMFCVPNKESIYQEYMPKRIRQYGNISRMEQFYKKAKEDYQLPFFYLKDTLDAYKNQYPLYFRSDTHWNQIGAFLAWRKMSEIILGNYVPFDNITIQPGQKIVGDMAKMLNITDDYEDEVSYEIHGYLTDVHVTYNIEVPGGAFALYKTTSRNKKTVLVIGDSFIHMLKPYLAKCYQTSIFVDLKKYDPILFDTYAIDDVIFLTVERNHDFFEHADAIIKGTYYQKED